MPSKDDSQDRPHTNSETAGAVAKGSDTSESGKDWAVACRMAKEKQPKAAAREAIRRRRAEMGDPKGERPDYVHATVDKAYAYPAGIGF